MRTLSRLGRGFGNEQPEGERGGNHREIPAPPLGQGPGMTRRRGGDSRPLTLEERRERFLQRERRGVETWSRLTPRQKRRQTKWQQHARQRENAARVALIMMMSGVEPPETLWRVLGLTDPVPRADCSCKPRRNRAWPPWRFPVPGCLRTTLRNWRYELAAAHPGQPMG
jgi:hypothetical protein